jgi:hypothetical protein
MEVVSLSPLPVASRVWQARPGAFVLTFVCKATFTLAPGELELAPEQDPVRDADCPWSASVTSLYAASDLVPGKPRADVVLVGNAYAPEGAPASHLVARLSIAEVDKSIEVWTNRTLDATGALVEGPPFTHVPLLYERAAGGPGTSNPVGLSPDERDGYGAITLPNLIAPGARVGSNEARLEPIGFGPVAATWPTRASRLGRMAQGWVPDRWDAEPLPAGFDMAYFNVAPPDQQPAALHGNEKLILENLHQEHRRLVMTLPGLRLSTQVEGAGGSRSFGLACDTLWIDTGRGICTLTYRGRVALSSPTEQGRVRVSLEEREALRPAHDIDEPTATGLVIPRGSEGSPLGAHDARPGFRLGTALGPGRQATAVFPHRSGSALPFKPAAPPPPPPPPPPTRETAQSWPEPRPEGAHASALPFRPAGTSVPPPWPPNRPGAPSAPGEARRTPLPPPLAPPPPAQRVVPPPPPIAMVPLASSPAPSASVAPPPPIVVAPSPIESPSTIGSRAASSPGLVQSPWAMPPATAGLGTIAPVVAAAAASPPAPGDFRNGAAAMAASNAAAGVSGGAYAAEPARPVSALVVPARPPPKEVKEPVEVIDLVFFDAESLPRIRRVPAWKKLLAELDERPLDADDDDPAAAKDPTAVEDRREISELLVRGTPSAAAELDAAVTRAVREDGRFFAPLVILAGELATPFDEVETLRATVTTISPLVAADENLRAQIDVAQDFLKLSGPLGASPAEGLTRRVRDAFHQGKRAVEPGYLDQATERSLLEQRAYQRRTILGSRRLRALFYFPSGGAPLVTYLSDASAPHLPLYPRFKARLIARVHLPMDRHEQSALALEALALARIVPPPGRLS